LSPTDVINAVNAQKYHTALPERPTIGTEEFDIGLNSSPKTLKELEDIPVRTMNGNNHPISVMLPTSETVFTPQTNIVRLMDGAPRCFRFKERQSIDAGYVQGERHSFNGESTLPEGLNIQTLSDQSILLRQRSKE